jgi:DNA-binding HxlR family transcriptional regulator
VLSERVRELREAGIVTPEGFALTGEGRELLAALAQLDAWAKRWRERS